MKQGGKLPDSSLIPEQLQYLLNIGAQNVGVMQFGQQDDSPREPMPIGAGRVRTKFTERCKYCGSRVSKESMRKQKCENCGASL